MLNMLKALKEKVDNIHEHVDVKREIKTLKNQKELLKVKSTVM